MANYGSGLYGADLYGADTVELLQGVPHFKLQAAFGSNPIDAVYAWTTLDDTISAATLTGTLRGFRYGRGRQNERNQVETGTSDILLADPNSAFDPNNTSSPYYPDVKPMCPIRMIATVDGIDYPMFLHYAERWPRTLRVINRYTERELSCSDGFAWLALAGIAGADYEEEASGDRFADVLDTVNWPVSLRNLAVGDTTIAAQAFRPDDRTTALSHLLAVTDTEDGLTFANGDGDITLINRHTLIVDSLAPADTTIQDRDGAPPAVLEYQELIPSYDLDNVTNDWSGTREGGVTQNASDTASQQAYGRRSQQITSLAIDDEEVLASVQWKLNQFKDPVNRIASVTIKPGRNIDVWKALLTVELGDRLELLETPPGFGAEQSTVYQVQHLDVTINRDIASSKFMFQLWPASVANWFILDDPVYGLLDEDNLLAY